MQKAIENKYSFIMLYDVTDGNPNGDPDANNMPRMDAETSIGRVTDVCLKRKIRNYVMQVKGNQSPYRIYVQDKAVLNNTHAVAYEALGEKASNKTPPKKVTDWLAENFYDIRTFGAVMTTAVNGGSLRGPVQLGFGKSFDPIFPDEVSISRMAVTNEKDTEKEKTFGNKWVVPYGLYKTEGFIDATTAETSGFSDEDLELLWESIMNMFEGDRSASRGVMVMRKLIIFKHDSKLGSAPSHKLSERLKVSRPNPDVPPRSFEDYVVEVDDTDLPSGVSLEIRD